MGLYRNPYCIGNFGYYVFYAVSYRCSALERKHCECKHSGSGAALEHANSGSPSDKPNYSYVIGIDGPRVRFLADAKILFCIFKLMSIILSFGLTIEIEKKSPYMLVDRALWQVFCRY